ncbi:hypothetical protein [Sphaerisporangium siamense]|uniref:Uncharacterized protein n=1 Tax=Sphaerisporangium siamense TaxID=795645 RepID=A0A7W7GAV2_9ACTN|nr:hypothetical protein [Sphaerisporangium siamense]MBB4704393.1 hypothetical protein [Sphaerisporangium siamense]
MRTRTVSTIVATAFLVVAALAVFAFLRARTFLDYAFQRPDPACVARAAADNERLAEVIAPRLPSVRPDAIEGGHGCEPPERGAWVEVELRGTSIEKALGGFASPAWTPLPDAKIREQAEPSQDAAAVSGKVDGREVDVYAIRERSGEGPVTILAWFADE